MISKARFLAVYDYGQGGVWVFVHARKPEEITRKYPELKVVTDHPEWLKGEVLERIETNMTFDIDSPPSGWLATLVGNRQK